MEVWQHLTTLAKVSTTMHLSSILSLQLEEQPTPGQLKPGPRAFISHQNKFGEETRGFIQSTQDLIGQAISSLITIVIDHLFVVYSCRHVTHLKAEQN